MIALRAAAPGQLVCLFALERTMGSRASRSLGLDAALLTAPPPPAETGGPAGGEEPAATYEPPGEEPAESPPAEEEPSKAEEEPPAEETPGEEEPPEAEGPPEEGEPSGEEELPISPEEPEEPVEPLVEEPSFVEEPPEPPSGEITRAFAGADWARGNIAGVFTWDGCVRTAGAPASYCAWTSYATIGPGASPSACASPERDWSSLGEDVSLVLWGGEAVGAGTHKFDFPGIWLDGSPEQLLCLAVIEVTSAGTYLHRLDEAQLTAPPRVSDAKVAPEN